MDYNLIIIGTIGGLIVQLARFLNPEEEFNFSQLKDYVPLILNPLISGFVVFAYVYSGTVAINSILALHIGISAPFIIKGMMDMLPTVYQKND